MHVKIYPTRELQGEITAPPSKSYTHRTIIAASLANGYSRIYKPLYSNDTRATINCCELLGTDIDRNDYLLISGNELEEPKDILNCRESGTTLRFMSSVASLAPGIKILDAEGRLKTDRPIKDLLLALKSLGVELESENYGPPIKIYNKLIGGETFMRGDESSQFLSSLLFATPKASRDSTIYLTTELKSKPYVDMTMEVLENFGVSIETDGKCYFVRSGQEFQPRNRKINGDYSSAANLLVAAAITGSRIKIGNLYKDKQGDREILSILKGAGACLKEEDDSIEIVGDRLRGVKVDISDTPDLGPILIVLGCYADGETILFGTEKLKLKESDRAEATSELVKMGANIEVGKNYIKVKKSNLYGTEIDPHNDHRYAMACGVAALEAKGKTTIMNSECVNKSYPGFFDDLESLNVRLEVLHDT